jgi:hypothetical protein
MSAAGPGEYPGDKEAPAAEPGISTRAMEIVVALTLLAVSALVIVDSYRLGSKWGDDGPQSGYFPFYIGVLLGLASLGTLSQVAFAEWQRGQRFRGAVSQQASQFVAWSELRLVLSVLLPALVYVLGVQFIGIYVASALYITLFMRWLGHYRRLKSVLTGVLVSASIFVMFEIWFKVPLFKGTYDPLSWLGY